MQRNKCNHGKVSTKNKFTVDQVSGNSRVIRKRSSGDRLYSLRKKILDSGHLFITMVGRRIKATFMCIGYILLVMFTLEKHGKII